MEGRHVHPSTLYPGGVGTVATVQLFTDYLTRLMRYVEFMKRVVPLHDDLFDFFYEALPGYEEVGRRRVLLKLLGEPQRSGSLRFQVREHDRLGSQDVRDSGDHRRRQAGHQRPDPDKPGHPHPSAGSSYYDDWEGKEVFVDKDPLGNPVDVRHPWNQHTIPKPQKNPDFDDKYSWVMSPRWNDGNEDHAVDTGGGPIARLWSTALSGLVDFGYVKATGDSVVINLPKTVTKPEKTFEWKIPQWSNAIERNRAAYVLPSLLSGLRALLHRESDGRGPRRSHENVGAVQGAEGRDLVRLH